MRATDPDGWLSPPSHPSPLPLSLRFIAIVNDSFTAAKDATASEEDFYYHLRDAIVDTLANLSNVRSVEDTLRGADKDNDGFIDMADLEAAFKDNPKVGR